MYRSFILHMGIRFLLTFLMLGLSWSTLSGQSRENLVKAGFVEKFTHFVEWPGSQTTSEGMLNVTVVGQVAFANDLNVLLEKARPNKVRFRYVSGTERIAPCDVLIVSRLMGGELDKILLQVRSRPILTISDGSGFAARGVMIQLFLRDDFVRFEVNLRALNSSGLKMNSMLLRSASKIHE